MGGQKVEMHDEVGRWCVLVCLDLAFVPLLSPGHGQSQELLSFSGSQNKMLSGSVMANPEARSRSSLPRPRTLDPLTPQDLRVALVKNHGILAKKKKVGSMKFSSRSVLHPNPALFPQETKNGKLVW